MRLLYAAALAVLVLTAATTPAGLGQARDPCVTTENRYSLRDAIPPIEGVLEGRLEERFYRFEELYPGETLNLFVEMEANTTTSASMLMLYEIRPDQYTQLVSRQIIFQGILPEEEGRFEWMYANLGNNRPTKICFKVGLFSEIRPARIAYRINIGIDTFLDTGNREAADRLEAATSLGSITGEAPFIVSGYLSSKDKGLDYVDIYGFTTSLGVGKTLVATVTTNEENNYEIAILDQTGFSLRYNETTQRGAAKLTLTNENPGETSYFLKVSNNGGVGGGGPYTVVFEVVGAQTSTTTTTGGNITQTQQTTIQPTIDMETARTIVYGAVVGIAAVSVAAAIITIRRRAQTYTVEEEL